MIVVSNTTPILSLSSIGQIDILEKLFKKVLVPKAVYDEIKIKEFYGYNEIDKSFFEIKEIIGKDYLSFLLDSLDIGEAESIVLAKELKANVLIIDEKIGRKIADLNQIRNIGTLSVLKLAKDHKIIQKVKPLLDDMIANGRWYSLKVYNDFLTSINE